MSATNLTKNLKLPQFVASDKPSWLGDFNGAMLKIDNGYGTLSGDISKANDTASSAKSQSDANTQTLTNVNSELENQGNRITALEAGGGTEQLEQRVTTLSSDVEALQTRADTFEEEIAQNGTSITTLKGRVDTLEPKVKTNADNITSLQTTTEGLTLSVQSIGEVANKAKTTADKANNTANSATTLASNAFNESQNNKTSISQLSSEISDKSNTKFFIATLSDQNNTYYSGNSCTVLYDDTGVLFSGILVTPKTDSSSIITSTGVIIGTYDISAIPNIVNKTLLVNDESIQARGNLYTMSLSKQTNSTKVTVTIKANTVSLTAPLIFNIYCIFN